MSGRTVPSPTSEVAPTRHAAHQEGIDFGGLLRLVWRRRLFIAAFVIIGMVICTVAITAMTRIYTARGLVLVGTPEANIVNLQGVLSAVSTETDAVDSATAVLQSWGL